MEYEYKRHGTTCLIGAVNIRTGTMDYFTIQPTRNEADHRIRIVYAPRHCSWLNPIENWFGRLQRQRLRNASFPLRGCDDSEN